MPYDDQYWKHCKKCGFGTTVKGEKCLCKPKKETIDQREKRANRLRDSLVKDFVRYHDIQKDSGMVSDIEYALNMMRNELL